MPTSLFEYLSQIDATMLASNNTSVPARERRAIVLAQSVDPAAGRGFDWLVPEAANAAKYIHYEQSADFSVFVFADRSVLVLLSTGYVYSVASANPDSLDKIANWLASHNITNQVGIPLRPGNHAFNGAKRSAGE